jgi:hypothetical protein
MVAIMVISASSLMSDACRQTVLLVFFRIRDGSPEGLAVHGEDARMTGFDAVVRVANLALQSSGEGVETLERYVARTASAYGIAVDVVVLPEQIILREKDAENVSNLAVVRATPGILTRSARGAQAGTCADRAWSGGRCRLPPA